MGKEINPFPVKGYISKEYFCDREKELNVLLRNVQNGVNTTLISPRRMGKTGLIFRFFEMLIDLGDYKTVYVDIYSSRNLSDFIKLLAEAIIQKFPSKTPIGKSFWNLLKGLRPVFTFDAFTGSPQIKISYQSESEKEQTLQQLLAFLDGQKLPVVVAIDEFQQIANYPESNMEALLRTYIQPLKQVTFIFSGSRRHTLMEIFSSTSRPFYSSTQFINLEAIDCDVYKTFIRDKFERGKRVIDEDSINFVMSWTKGYTFYTQSICNRLYPFKKITPERVKAECNDLLLENESVYLQYRNLLTQKQWNFLAALAKEESVTLLYSSEFLMKYRLGSPSSVQGIVNSLIDKEMIREQIASGGTSYCVYDVFLMRWLQRIY